MGSAQTQIGGTLTMYTPNSETLVNNLIPDFEDRTGITVDLIQAGTGELFKKIQSEAGNPIADIMWGASSVTRTTRSSSSPILLQKIRTS